MIQLNVEVSNLDTGDTKNVTFPCNLRTELPDFFDCIILSVSPDIQISRNDEIERLNDVLDEINSENPSMDETIWRFWSKHLRPVGICSTKILSAGSKRTTLSSRTSPSRMVVQG